MAEGAPTGAAARRGGVLVAGGALLAVAASLALQDIRSYDYWWQLRAGQLIADTGAIPRSDPFTYTVPGARWIDIHWLHQLGLHALHAAGGHAAVVVAIFALVCAWLAALLPIGWRPERPWLSAGALAWMLVVSANRLKPRPELPSFVLLALVLHLLDRFERRGDRWVFAIVPLQLVWVNLHGLFAVGIAVCAIHLAAELLRPLGRAGEGMRWARVRTLAASTALAALVSLANPNGLDGALYPLAQLDMVGSADRRGAFGNSIAELLPPIGSFGAFGLTAFLGLAALSLGAIAANWRRVREADLLLWVAFFYLALGAGRNVALFSVAAAPILVRNANEALDRRPLSARAGAAASALVAALALFVAQEALRGTFHTRIGPYRTPGFGVIEGFNPIGAAEWILRARPPAPIAHSLADGGYLIWRLWPEYRVMLDGRLEVFGEETLIELARFSTPEGFAALDARWHFGSALLDHRRMDVGDLVKALRARPEWRLAYADDVSVVFVRSDRAGPGVPELDLDEPGRFAALDDVPEIPAHERLLARTRLLVNLGRPDLALETWKQLLARFPDEPHGRERLAALRARRAGPPAPRRRRAAGHRMAPTPRYPRGRRWPGRGRRRRACTSGWA